MGSEGCGWGDLSRGATPPWLWELLLGSWVKITTMMLTKVTVPSRRRMWHGAPGRLRGARLAMTTVIGARPQAGHSAAGLMRR